MNDTLIERVVEELERIAAAQERIAAAEEQRNAILDVEIAERREAWAQSRLDAARDLDAILGSPEGQGRDDG